jgi:hypothetical protein
MLRNATVASLFILLYAGFSVAQGSVTDLSPEQARPTKNSDLMARSEMQSPKSIPIVKLLRFREIPVNGPADRCPPDNRLPGTVQDAEVPAPPAIQVEKPSEQGIVIATPDRP